MSDRDALVAVRRELVIGLAIIDAQLNGPVNPPPPPPPPPPPVAPTNKPTPIGINYGPDLTGTDGNARAGEVYNVISGTVTRWRYSGSGRKQFTSGGQSTNGAPANVWVWAEGPRGYITTPAKIGGSGTAPIEPIDVNGEVWFCEQIEAEPGTVWNRYAQVNPGTVTTPGRGSSTPTQPPPR